MSNSTNGMIMINLRHAADSSSGTGVIPENSFENSTNFDNKGRNRIGSSINEEASQIGPHSSSNFSH
jgi:hypothetical protein